LFQGVTGLKYLEYINLDKKKYNNENTPTINGTTIMNSAIREECESTYNFK
jgi:hypothetical protein